MLTSRRARRSFRWCVRIHSVMCRGVTAMLVLAVLVPGVPAGAQSPPSSFSAYDDFSLGRLDRTKWYTQTATGYVDSNNPGSSWTTDQGNAILSIVREIRNQKLALGQQVSSYGNGTANSNQLFFPKTLSAQGVQIDAALTDFQLQHINSFARLRLQVALYNSGGGGTIGTDAIDDIRARLYLRGDANGVGIYYDVLKCTDAVCNAVTTVLGPVKVRDSALNQVHQLGVTWDGSTLTFSVDAVSVASFTTSSTPVPLPAITRAAPNVVARYFDTQVVQAGVGGEARVSGTVDNVYVDQGSGLELYDDFNTTALLDSTKWGKGDGSDALDLVRELQNGALHARTAFAGTTFQQFRNRLRPVNQVATTGVKITMTINEFQVVNAGLNVRPFQLVVYNDGSSTAVGDGTGDILGQIRVTANSNGTAQATFRVDRCTDPNCIFSSSIFSQSLGDVSVGAAYQYSLRWTGTAFEYQFYPSGTTPPAPTTYDPRPQVPPTKVPGRHWAETRLGHIGVTASGGYGYIDITLDDIQLNPEAANALALRPAYQRQVTVNTGNPGVVSAGTGMLGTGSGSVTLSGIPAGAVVERAFAYVTILGEWNPGVAPTLDGTLLAMGPPMTRSDAPDGTFRQACVYLADATNIVAAKGGNGTYAFAGFADGTGDTDTLGGSLVVVYSEPTPAIAQTRVISMKDGAVTIGGGRNRGYGTQLGGFVAATPPTGASVTYVVGGGTSQPLDFGGINQTIAFNNAFSGSDGPAWDTRSGDVSASLPATATRAGAALATGNDSLVWVAAILSVPGRLHTDAVGVFRPNDGTFYLDHNASGQWDGCGTDRCLQIGMSGDVPLVGDWNGSGTSKVGAFRPSDGTFYLDYNGNGAWDGCGTDRCLQIGMLGDIPLVGDWNGNGSSKVGAFRPSDGTFYLDYNGSGTWEGCGTDRCLQIGMLNDSPLVGDWNGSGTAKVGAFRPSDGTFYLDYNGSGTWEGCGTDRCLQIGMLNDSPLVGDWNGSGSTKVGVFRPSDGTFYLDYDGSGSWNGCGTDRCLQIGLSGDRPLVGKW